MATMPSTPGRGREQSAANGSGAFCLARQRARGLPHPHLQQRVQVVPHNHAAVLLGQAVGAWVREWEGEGGRTQGRRHGAVAAVFKPHADDPGAPRRPNPLAEHAHLDRGAPRLPLASARRAAARSYTAAGGPPAPQAL